MIYYLIICRSLTYAQRSAKALERAGITATVLKTPQNIAAEGCGYSVKVPINRLNNAVLTLKKVSLDPRRIFEAYDNGEYIEVPT